MTSRAFFHALAVCAAFECCRPWASAVEATPGAEFTIRLTHPEIQGERLIGWFRGSRAPHPAAALAAWKHASRGRNGLGKGLEALIAAFNPGMVRESGVLDGAELRIVLDPATGRYRWRVVVPRDDGSLAALVTALALTDGATLEPFKGAPVYRLGPVGGPSASLQGARVTIVSNSAQLNAAFPLAIPAGFRESDSGGRFRLEFGGLREIQPIALARAFEAAEALGCRAVDGILSVEADGLSVAFATRLPGRSRIGLNPSWLDPVTGPRAVVGGALALETGGPSLEAAFALADRVEKVDPTRAGVAPLRTRLNLLAAAARAQPEADLWPHLKGLSGGVLASPDGQVSGALIGLHTSSAEAAGRIARVVLPRLAAAYLGGKAPAGDSKVEADDAIPLGKIDGRPLRAQVRGATVWVGWGEHALNECADAEAHPERSQARAWLRAPGGQVLQRAGAFWPGRTWEMALPGSPRTKALAEAPPVVWLGHTDGPVARDVIRWTGLSEVVRRWLDALPLESPPDKAGPG